MSGHGQVVAVVAEAGTGKSRLVYEFKATLPSDCRVLEAYSVSHGKASAWLPVLELLHSYFGIEGVDDPPTRREEVERQAGRARPGAQRHAAVPVWAARDPGKRRSACCRWTRRSGAGARSKRSSGSSCARSLKHPLVVIFEDLHWIDSETQALLDLLADSIANSRLLLLVNYRPEYRHEWANKSYYSQFGWTRSVVKARVRCWRRCSGDGGRTGAAQAADRRAHRRQSVLHRGDGAGAVRRGRADAQRRSQGYTLALATAAAADCAGHPGLAHRPAFGGAEGTAPDPCGDRAGVAAWPDQESGRHQRRHN